MKIFIDISHPAHVHLFKNIFWKMEKRGHIIKITARDKDVTKKLLQAYNIPYELVGYHPGEKTSLIKEWIIREYKIFKIAKKFLPDCFLGTLNPAIAHAARLLKKSSVIFTDFEPEITKFPVGYLLTAPFVGSILTPTSVRHDYGEKAVKISTYKELAYLHPNYFKPNPKVLKDAGISKHESYVILRFVSWQAHHDIQKKGFTLKEKIRLVKELSEYSTVFITSEGPLPREFEKYRLPIPVEKIHDFLYYAKLLVCDSQTMATEAGVLGTPAIRSNSFVGARDMGNFIELEERYGLIYNIREPQKAIEKAVELMQLPNLKKVWKKKQKRLLEEKIDLTSFMIWFLENYPDSFEQLKENPKIQYRFR